MVCCLAKTRKTDTYAQNNCVGSQISNWINYIQSILLKLWSFMLIFSINLPAVSIMKFTPSSLRVAHRGKYIHFDHVIIHFPFKTSKTLYWKSQFQILYKDTDIILIYYSYNSSLKKWEVLYTIRTKVNIRVFIVLHCLMVGIVWILSKNIFDWKYNFMKNAISTKLFAVGIISYDWNMISIKQTCMKI